MEAAGQAGENSCPAGFADLNRTAQKPAEIDRRAAERKHPVAGPGKQFDHQPPLLLDADHDLANIAAKVGEQPMQLPQPPPPLLQPHVCHKLARSIQHAYEPANGVEAGEDHQVLSAAATRLDAAAQTAHPRPAARRPPR